MSDHEQPDRAAERALESDDPLALAASAVVDGTAGDDERSLVETHPDGPALVERFSMVAAAVADVEAPLPEVRDRHLAAALAAFDDAADGAVGTTVVRSPGRPWERSGFRQILGAAAAVLAVGVLGVVVATQGGSEDDSADVGDAATQELATAAADDSEMSGEMFAESDDAPAATDRSDGDATEPAPMESAEEDDGGGDTMLEDAPDSDLAVGDDAEATPEATPEVLAGPADLAALGERALEDHEIMTRPAPDDDPCIPTGAVLVGPAIYAGTDVIVVIRDAESDLGPIVGAIDPLDCTIVAEVTLDISD